MSWIETIYWPEPPKVLFFEKPVGGRILNCQVIVEADHASVLGDEEDICARFEFGTDSEGPAVAFVEAHGYIPAEDWKLPPSTGTA